MKGILDARKRYGAALKGMQDGPLKERLGELGERLESGVDEAWTIAQAGNQLLALQAQQLADLTAVVAANGRAQALTEAERAAAAEQGREQRRRFLTPGAGYQPGNARMFPNGN